jgi:hypothetical protein
MLLFLSLVLSKVVESTVHDIVVWVGDTLIECGKFNFSGKKELFIADNGVEVVLVDVMESSVECSKKSSVSGAWEKRSVTQLER